MKNGELGRVYADNELIFGEGDKGDIMYVVQSGRVKITKLTQGGELTLATLQGGDLFGEMAIFDKRPRSATARALGNARVLGIDKKKLFRSISHDPTLMFKMLETMSSRIRTLNEKLAAESAAKTEMQKIFY